MKRKASELDENSDDHSWVSQSPLSDSSVCSYDSLDRFNVNPIPWPLRSIPAPVKADTINPRTRKRFRDNRPDLKVIHQNTLAKLYNAQKNERVAPINSEVSFSSPSNNVVSGFGDHQHEHRQQSLHSFFNIRQSQPCKEVPSPYQHLYSQSSTEGCYGCGNHLHSNVSDPSGEQDMMVIDQLSGTALDEDYECAACRRRVCDTCAVRGDHRICLECALPGAG